ncbi:complement C5-like [Dreissena polymorpha]|uniref:complement C5-like n=1 Tax=Dreissena polymorpha TaxID=45954 RepID=UPI002263BDD0|nr:complement C5-like [Dreissena polymorpha]
MDESMKPIKDKQLKIDLISPTGQTVGRATFDPGKSNNGFYRGKFQLPPLTDSGTWTIKAKLGGKLETYAIAPIEVREFVLPTFGVEISTRRDYILPNETNMDVTVSAKYFYGKAVEGIAGLDINVRKEGGVSDPERVVTMGRHSLKDGNAFFVVNITKIVQGLGGQFPADAVLELSSRVYESATGKEESRVDDSLMFVECPFKFDFSRSKTTYRKGIAHYMQINMLYANGKPAHREVFHLTIDGGTPQEHRSNYDGHYVARIPAANQNFMSRIIQVYAPGFEKCTTGLVLQPYTGDSQIVVDKVDMEGTSFIWANTTINMNQAAQYTGILMLITARGRIVETRYFPPSIDQTFQLEQDVLDKVSPVGRVFAFYVHNAQLVADSSIFHVDAKCREKMELHLEHRNVWPSTTSKLTVTGPSGMWVGFNVIDKAMLQLNNKNVLMENKIFNEMEAHDLGCGAGGRTNSEEIFKNAGLTILTNANVNDERIHKETIECVAMNRKRRDVNGDKDLKEGSGESVLSGQDHYQLDVGMLKNMGITQRVRKNFETSFFFEEHVVSARSFSTVIKYRESITEWSIQAIGISENTGACIAVPKKVQAFRHFFIQVDLPNKVTRKEKFNVKSLNSCL